MPQERRMLVLGRLTEAHMVGPPACVNQWRFLEVPSLEAAAERLSGASDMHVGLWPYGPSYCAESFDKFSVLRRKHRQMQWLALLPGECINDLRLAELIALQFFDYLTMPVDPQRLFSWAGHAYGMSLLVESTSAHAEFAPSEEQMVGTSEGMRALFRNIRKVASSDAPVFVCGESGTGKELTARAIHERSARARGPFVALDCGALPPALIHSELFGHEKGAFTGAAQRKIGRIEVAQGGTLFLDEIGNLPLDLQTNLLRFLQESTIQRVGGTRPISIDARVIAATHVDLEEAVRQGRFRQDLYYRLNVLRVSVPPLREREGDIEVLARYFLMECTKATDKRVHAYTAQALEAMRQYEWPGNVRELINRVRRAVVMCDGAFITAADLDLSKPVGGRIATLELEAIRDIAEREAINKAIKTCRNNHSAAARMLGISRVTLYRLINKHRLPTQTGSVDYPGL